MRARAASLSAVLLLVGAGGCSAITSTDPTDLEPGMPGADAGPGPDAGPPPDGGTDGGPGGCEGLPRCEGATLVRCEDGEPAREDCPVTCLDGDGAPRCGRMIPSNVEAGLWDREAEDLDLRSGEFGFDTGECRAEGADSEVVRIDDGIEVCVLMVHDFRIRRDAVLQLSGERPFVLMASGEVRIEGDVDARARRDQPGPGGFPGGVRERIDGGGRGGGGGGVHENSFDDGGGGGGALCGEGGPGGGGGEAPGGEGGVPLPGGWELEPLVGGSGGGRGRGLFVSPAPGDTNAGLGGAGGGAVQISALGSIGLAGAILAGGGGGSPGANRFGSGANWGSGGGGGSGGAVLLEAPEVHFDGGRIEAPGGGGGGSADSTGNGEAGQDGWMVDGRASGGVGAPGTLAGDGGDSGGGGDLEGLAGQMIDEGSGNGGGGGGGAGCILLRTADAEVSGTEQVNPSAGPGYRVLRVRTD